MKRESQTILVTGGAGYVGSVLVHLLLREGYAVRVADNLRWGGTALLGAVSDPRFDLRVVDLRHHHALGAVVEGVDGIVHLAAIVGDPACRAAPALAEETNYAASVALLEAAKARGVPRFVFASTCSNYGKMADPAQWCDEAAPLRPVSLYAELKVKFEQYLFAHADGICATALRFSTAYGLSPRMRFDLTVNEFTREVAMERELVVYGEKFWRPYCHTVDLARACQLALEASTAAVHGHAFNIGDDAENYQKAMLVEAIRRQIPGLRVQYVHRDEDPRDYRVRFGKIQGLGFRVSRRVPEGIREVASVIRDGVIPDPDDKRYANV